MRDKIYIPGLILVILSFVACILSFFLVIFALPVFIIGSTLIFFSKKKIVTKLLSVIVPLLLFPPSSYLFITLYNKTTPLTILIPSDYEGQFCVVFGEECGLNPVFEGGRMVLNIPQNGILIIQPEFESGIIDYEYYLVDKTGKRQKINKLDFYNERSKSMPAVLFGGTGSIGGAMPDGSFSSESPLAMTYEEFAIYNKDTVAADKNETEQLIDSLVNTCRQK